MACALPVVAAEATGRDQPRPRRRHRHPGRCQRHRGLCRRARGLCARSRAAPAPRRGRPRRRQDDGLGPDQLEAGASARRIERRASSEARAALTLGIASVVRIGASGIRLDPLDLLRGFVEDPRDFVQQIVVEPVAADAVAKRGHQILDRPADRRPGAAALARREIAQPLEQRLDLLLALLEMRRGPRRSPGTACAGLRPAPPRSGPCPGAGSASDR